MGKFGASLIASGVVEGERGGTPFPQIILRGNGVPLNRNGARGNAEAVTFPQMTPPYKTTLFCTTIANYRLLITFSIHVFGILR
jgi:hypothetical protein